MKLMLVGMPKQTFMNKGKQILCCYQHYNNTALQLTVIFNGCKNGNYGNFYMKNCDIFSSSEPLGSQGELIVYPCSGVRPSSVVHSQFQTSSPLKPLGQSKPNFMWSLLGKGEQKFV